MFEKNKMIQTYTNKPTTIIICPTCNIPMLLRQYYGGGFYWFCGRCSCTVERTNN